MGAAGHNWLNFQCHGGPVQTDVRIGARGGTVAVQPPPPRAAAPATPRGGVTRTLGRDARSRQSAHAGASRRRPLPPLPRLLTPTPLDVIVFVGVVPRLSAALFDWRRLASV